jgi:hypothetical protein
LCHLAYLPEDLFSSQHKSGVLSQVSIKKPQPVRPRYLRQENHVELHEIFKSFSFRHVPVMSCPFVVDKIQPDGSTRAIDDNIPDPQITVEDAMPV